MNLPPDKKISSLKIANIALAIILIVSLIFSVCVGLNNRIGVKETDDILFLLRQNLSTVSGGVDSWYPMLEAIKSHEVSPEKLIYENVFFEKKIKFQYPLSSLLVFELAHALGISSESAIYALNMLCLAASLLIPLLLYKIYTVQFESSIENQVISKTNRSVIFLMCILTTLFSYPLQFSVYIGQVQAIITFMVALIILCFHLNQLRLVGFLVGICGAIKPHLGILLIWAALRRQWNIVVPALITLTLLYGLSSYIYGFENVIEYQKVLVFLTEHGEGYSRNQSINGLVNRALMNGNNLEWMGNYFPSFHPYVYKSTLLSSFLLLSIAIFWRYKSKPSVTDLGIVLVCITMASPIAWEHHYAILLPVLISMLACLSKDTGFRKLQSLAILIFSWVIINLNLAVLTDPLWNTPFNFLQSFIFFGSLLALTLLLSISSKK